MFMRKKTLTAIAVSAALTLAACSDQADNASADTGSENTQSQVAGNDTAQLDSSNPFAQPSELQYEAPDFSIIEDDHFLPAFEQGMQDHMAEIEAIATNPEP